MHMIFRSPRCLLLGKYRDYFNNRLYFFSYPFEKVVPFAVFEMAPDSEVQNYRKLKNFTYFFMVIIYTLQMLEFLSTFWDFFKNILQLLSAI